MATTESKNELLPAKQREYLRDIDQTLRLYHDAMKDADYAYSSLMAEFAAVQTENRLRELLHHPGIVTIFRQLANTKRGYSVAHRGGIKDLNDQEVVDCMIDAAMKGLRFRGNEFTVIAKGVYANKEAYKRFLREMNVRYQCHIGVPDASVRKGYVYIDGRVEYQYRGDVGALDFRNKEECDGRIVLKAYDTDSPDLHRGKAESKLLRRLFEHLTGAALPCFADNDDEGLESTAERLEDQSTFDENGFAK